MRRTALIWDKKKEQYSLSYGESRSRLACHHGRSVLFLMYVICDYLSHTHKIPAYPTIIIIIGIDPYIGYCIQHIDQYYANKFVMSVFAISVKV